MNKQEKIDKHNEEVLKMMIDEPETKIGAKEIRSAYFRVWYESCRDIYNADRRRKRKENKKKGKKNG